MNSNFEHLVNTPAPERDGMSEALRRMDWALVERLVDGELRHCEKLLAHDNQSLEFSLSYYDPDVNNPIHNAVDGRVHWRNACRDLLRNLSAIRALRKELGL